MYGCGKDFLILIPFRLPQISCFTLSLKCFSYHSDDCPEDEWPVLQFPDPVVSVLLTFLFFPLVPSSYQVLRGSIYSFPLIRHSCPLSAGVPHAPLCLKVYSWCICGERCSPHPPTPLPSCSLVVLCLLSDRFSARQQTSLEKNHDLLPVFLTFSSLWHMVGVQQTVF